MRPIARSYTRSSSSFSFPLIAGFVLLMFFVPFPAHAGSGWTAQESGTTLDLYGLSFVDSQNGWAAGGETYGGGFVILNTTDGGEHWGVQTTGPGAALLDIRFVDLSNGWAVGEFGTVIHTTDGGHSWYPQESNDDHNLFSLFFLDHLNGWIAGDWQTMLHTTDGGVHWEQQSIASYRAVRGLQFLDAHKGWTAGNGGDIFSTTDSGNTWLRQESGTMQALASLAFIDESTGWAVGGNWGAGGGAIVLHTTDGGETWVEQESGATEHLIDVFFTDDSNGWIVGGYPGSDPSVILHTQDGGATWERQDHPASDWLLRVTFPDESAGWAVGSDGMILHTTTGGGGEGLVAYFPFNGNANDESGNGNDGTVNGPQLTTDRFGIPASAYQFDGENDYIDYGNSPQLVLVNELSISAWIWVEEFPPLNEYYTITLYGVLGETEDTNQPYHFNIHNDNGTLRFRLDHEWGEGNNEEVGLGSVAHEGWNHIVVVRNTDLLQTSFFVDGVLDTTVSYQHNPTGGESGRGTIGAWLPPSITTRYFDGTIDDIRIYDRQLSDAEILDLYEEGGWPNIEPTLAAYYPFNGNANDESGNGNDGTAQGAVLTTDRFGNANSAYSFDGINDFIAIGSDESLLILESMSICAWVNTASTPYHHSSIIARGEYGETEDVNHAFHLQLRNEVGSIVAGNTHEHGSGIDTDVSSEVDIPMSSWLHVGFARDAIAQTYRFYVNGQAEEEIPYGNNPTGGWNTSGYIGWSPLDSLAFFHGMIDDIRVFRGVVTDEMIAEFYEENGWVVTADSDPVLPDRYELHQNYPNPFNPSTTIEFDLPEAGQVRLRVYDVLGQEVAILVNGDRTAGKHRVVFNAGPLASGMYIYRIEAGEYSATKKLLLVE